MSTELWLDIIRYFIGVLIIFTLLVSLMEASRKFDRFHDSTYLLLATGYFLLLVWALLQAMSLGNGLLRITAMISQLIGLICLAFGYHYFAKTYAIDDDSSSESVSTQRPASIAPAETAANSTPPPASMTTLIKTQPIENSQAGPAKKADNRADWVKLLAVDSTPPPVLVSPTEALVETIEKLDDTTADKSIRPSPPIEKKAKPLAAAKPNAVNWRGAQPATSPPADNTVDLSYLSKRTRKVNQKVRRIEGLEPSAANQAGNSTPPPTEKAREEIMDELFPVSKKTTKPEAALLSNPATKEPAAPNKSAKPIKNDTALPGEEAAISKKNASAGLVAAGFGLEDWFSAWPEVAAAVIYLVLLIILIPQRHYRGHNLLISGFAIILLSAIASILFASPANAYLGLGIPSLELIGFALIGAASWLKIKGKVTHHFLRIVSIIYLVLIILTIGLATVIVRDQISLQLLLLLMTGVLIMILPIIHAMTYYHPSQAAQPNSIV